MLGLPSVLHRQTENRRHAGRVEKFKQKYTRKPTSKGKSVAA